MSVSDDIRARGETLSQEALIMIWELVSTSTLTDVIPLTHETSHIIYQEDRHRFSVFGPSPLVEIS